MSIRSSGSKQQCPSGDGLHSQQPLFRGGITAGAVEYTIDAARRTLSTSWSHTRSDDFLPMLGSTQRLESGNTLISYGASGLVEEVTPSGEPVWLLRSPFGAWMGGLEPLPASAHGIGAGT